MTKADAKKRIEKLRREIDHYRYAYHVLDTPEISDAALDSLKDELVKLEQQYPDLITPDSPTQRVAGEPLAKFDKVQHATPMLSLNDAFNEQDIADWISRLQRLDDRAALSYYAEPKVDGLALSLIYEAGVLTLAATRGNGLVGENVTHNIRTIESVPLRLRPVRGVKLPQRLEVRGEVYLTKKSFAQINAERKKAGEPLYMNPRNTAAGSIRQLDAALAASRELRFMAYGVPTDIGQTSHHAEHEFLHAAGFKTEAHTRQCNNLDDIMAYYRDIGKQRERIPYQIDGIVVTVDTTRLFQKFGVVGKAPRGALAIKFPAEQTTTVVEDIHVQVGRTGALTPVAHLRPVQVAGTTVKRATLHNMDEIKRLGVKIGDTVIIQKAGDIIPDVVQVLPKLRSGAERNFRMPKRCPVCHSPVRRTEGEVAYYCSNPNCFGQQREQLYHFVSRKALDIVGLGPKIIDALVAAGLVTTAADIFRLQESDLAPLERFAETSAKKLVASIQAHRRVPLERFLYGLGIRHVGEQTAIDLADHFGSLEHVQAATAEQLAAVSDIGPVVAQSISAYFQDQARRQALQQLVRYVGIINPTKQRSSSALAGKSFVFTGTLESMTRDDAKARVRANGGQTHSSITKDLDYLVVGAEPGSKLAKAEKLGVTVLSEADFLRLLQS